jgi:hypothetical protein
LVVVNNIQTLLTILKNKPTNLVQMAENQPLKGCLGHFLFFLTFTKKADIFNEDINTKPESTTSIAYTTSHFKLLQIFLAGSSP